jgi:integrative and conjugative element protein (TIGR02256 family)
MTVWLDRAARAQIEREARRWRLRETGGPLFGFDDDDTDQLVIVGAGGPGPRAKHQRRLFIPDRAAVYRAIARVHEASNGRYAFLGSWHTHPLGRPAPSPTDIATAREVAADGETDLPRPLVLIQATNPLRRTLRDRNLRAWRWSILDERLEPAPLAIVGKPAYLGVELDWAAVVS